MNASLRIDVVGLGVRSPIARHLASVTYPTVLVGGCDPNPAMRKCATHTLGEGQWVVILEELPGLSIDAVIVTSPDDTYEDVTCSLLEVGVAVFLGKPVAITIEGADRVLETIHRACTPLYVSHNIRHMDVVRMLRRVIQRRRIGEVEAIRCRRFIGNEGGCYFKDQHAGYSRTTDLLLQKAAHNIDVMNWLSDSMSTRVVTMGGLMVYGALADRSGQGDGAVMEDWFSLGN